MAGHPVVAVAPISIDIAHAESRIRTHFMKAKEEGMVKEDSEFYFNNLVITEDYSLLEACRLVIECTLENQEIKKAVYAQFPTVWKD